MVLLALAMVGASCATLGSGGFNGKPADIYSVVPNQADVRTLLGDNDWWVGTPTFGVLPLDSMSTPTTVRFWVSQPYVHLGTAEQMLARYTVYDKASSATSAMSEYQNAYGTSPTSPKVGDQVLYYGLQGSSAAPFATRTFVRVGQIVVLIVWTRRDAIPTVAQLGKNASKFVAGLKDLSKVHARSTPVDPNLLPPPGLDITLLGSTQLPVESFVVMILAALPDPILALMRGGGINDFAYADYALNSDTHMEVQTGLLTFPTAADAADWASTFSPGTPDSNGIGGAYLPIGGSPAAGVYHYIFSSGKYGALVVCKSSIDGEAASRECEDPMKSTALAWKLALGGLR
ncbi:MAG: hypothetical protein E6I71_11530 [Chloroflexi bacterium]|nr:MAG: hypothetical protein E6I71_11530 [Chloroflexota bacterium]